MNAYASEGEAAPRYGVWRFAAPAEDPTVPRARHTVRDLLASRGVPLGDPVTQGLLLILSELVTNAVRHAAVVSPEIVVELAIGPDRVRVAVEDEHPYRPKALEADFADTGGRGLLLVKAITREAGGLCDVERLPGGGKVVWAALPRPLPGMRPRP